MKLIQSRILKKISIAFVAIVVDLAVYFLLALLLMNYDDFYEESKGPYWSLESMTFWQQVNYVSLIVWNILNVLVISFLVYKIVIGIWARRSMSQ